MHDSICPEMANYSNIYFVIQVDNLEFAQVEQKVINGLKQGNESLKKMHEVSTHVNHILV